MGDSVGRTHRWHRNNHYVLHVVTGLILWFPAQIRNIKQGLTIKTSANWKRLNHDLHNTLGFYSSVFLLIMVLTGLCWSFGWYRNGVSSVLGAKVFKGRTEKPLLSRIKIRLFTRQALTYRSILLSETNQYFPYKGISRLSIPEVRKFGHFCHQNRHRVFSVAGTDKIQYDRFTGKVISTGKVFRQAVKRSDCGLYQNNSYRGDIRNGLEDHLFPCLLNCHKFTGYGNDDMVE